jgi:hypothetical protein
VRRLRTAHGRGPSRVLTGGQGTTGVEASSIRTLKADPYPQIAATKYRRWTCG